MKIEINEGCIINSSREKEPIEYVCVCVCVCVWVKGDLL